MLDKLFGSVDLNSQEILDQLERVKQRQRKDIERIKSTNNIGSRAASPVPTHEDRLQLDEDRPRNLDKLPTTSDVLSNVSSDAMNFDDIDDDEIDAFLLTEEESSLKERVWIGLNEDFLLEQEQKRLKAEADEISGHQQARKKKKPQPKSENDALNDVENDGIQGAINSIGEPSSASAAARSVLSKKASKKINYLALNNLFEEN